MLMMCFPIFVCFLMSCHVVFHISVFLCWETERGVSSSSVVGWVSQLQRGSRVVPPCSAALSQRAEAPQRSTALRGADHGAQHGSSPSCTRWVLESFRKRQRWSSQRILMKTKIGKHISLISHVFTCFHCLHMVFTSCSICQSILSERSAILGDSSIQKCLTNVKVGVHCLSREVPNSALELRSCASFRSCKRLSEKEREKKKKKKRIENIE